MSRVKDSDFSAFLQQFVDISHKKLGHKGQGGKSYCKILSTKVLLVLPTYFFHVGTVRGNSAKAKYTFYFDCIIKMIDLAYLSQALLRNLLCETSYVIGKF